MTDTTLTDTEFERAMAYGSEGTRFQTALATLVAAETAWHEARMGLDKARRHEHGTRQILLAARQRFAMAREFVENPSDLNPDDGRP